MSYISVYLFAILSSNSVLQIFTLRTVMASLHVYSLILSALTYCSHAFPAPPSSGDTLTSNARWSKEAVLALAGVLVAILLFVLGIASKTIRRWVINTFSRTYGMPLRRHPRLLRQSVPNSALLHTVKKTIPRHGYCGGVHRSGWSSMNGEHTWREE